MINLLPPEEKQKLFLRKKEKLAAILGIVAVVFLICLILILSSIKFYVSAEVDYQKTALQQTKQENQTLDAVNLDNIIQKYNGVLTQLDSFYKKEIHFSRVLKNISDIPTPKDLRFTNFSLNRDPASGTTHVMVAGVSGTRDELLFFKNNIGTDKQIINPYFSPESWISPKNANFSLTFEIHENEEK